MSDILTHALGASHPVWYEAFDQVPLALWIEDFTEACEELQALADSGVKDMRSHLHGDPDLIRDLARKTQILDVNQVGITQFGAGALREDLLGDVERFLVPEALPVFADELLALFQGETQHQAIVTTGTLDKKTVSTRMQISLLPNDTGRKLTLLSFVVL